MKWKHEVAVFCVLATFQGLSQALQCSENSGNDQLYKCAQTETCYTAAQRCDHNDDCGDFSDEQNCTFKSSWSRKDVTHHIVVNTDNSDERNFAWLVTPMIFGMGVIYAIYKCFKEGLCNLRKLQAEVRRRNLSGGGATSESQRHLMLVHNQSFTVSIGGVSPPSVNQDCPPPPPSYEEAIAASAAGSRNNGFSALPQESPLYDVSCQLKDPDLPPYSESLQGISLMLGDEEEEEVNQSLESSSDPTPARQSSQVITS